MLERTRTGGGRGAGGLARPNPHGAALLVRCDHVRKGPLATSRTAGTPAPAFERTWMLRVANSTPMVDFISRQNSLRVNRLSRLDLPTPESPMSTTLKR